MENKPKINMTRIVISGLLMLSVVLTGVNSRGVMALTEFTDEEGKHWSDISLAINEWPLNTFSIFRISEFNFDKNRIKVIFGVPDDSIWEPGEMILAWQNRAERFSYKDFAEIFTGNAMGNYEIIMKIDLTEENALIDGGEIGVDFPAMDTNIKAKLGTHNLLYAVRSVNGDVMRPQLVSLSSNLLAVSEGEIARLFYRDPVPDGGASSGLMNYFAIKAEDVTRWIEPNEESETIEEVESTKEVEKNKEAESAIEESEPIEVVEEKLETGKDEVAEVIKTDEVEINKTTEEVGKGGGVEVIDNNSVKTPDEIRIIENVGEKAKNDKNYSSGDIFADNVKNSAPSKDDKENDADEVIKLIEESEAEKKGIMEADKKGIMEAEKIEVPRLGMTAKEIDYKWLFLPVLGLILMIYWWFLVPIWKKHEKSEKKSKKSVDNI